MLFILQGSSSVLVTGAKGQHQHKEEQGQKKVSPMGNEEMHIAVPQGKEALALLPAPAGPGLGLRNICVAGERVFSPPFLWCLQLQPLCHPARALLRADGDGKAGSVAAPVLRGLGL